MASNTDPDRCLQPAGLFEPVIDPGRCEAKGPCVPACPYGVLEIRPLTSAQKSALSLLGRLKAAVHGNRRAMAAHAGDCRACGLCVQVCPEQAISLRRRA